MYALNERNEYLRYCLLEDVQAGDVTSLAIVPLNHTSVACIVAKQTGIFSGAQLVFDLVSLMFPIISVDFCVDDGFSFVSGVKLVQLSGNTIELLKLERTLMNFLQRLSGIATLTQQFVAAVLGTDARIYDTRKTMPGMRFFEKKAVCDGGACNHRNGLFDAVLIKENHIQVAGSITSAVKKVRMYLASDTGNSFKPDFLEIETQTLVDVQEALIVGVDIILLDNMSNELMSQSVALIRKHKCSVKIEASGNMTLSRIPSVAALGVDRISVGALTHSALAVDMTFLLEAGH